MARTKPFPEVERGVVAARARGLTRAGRVRPAGQAAIWLVVVLKLARPWGPAMPWSLSDLLATLTDSSSGATPFVLTEQMTRAPVATVAWPAVGWIALAAVWLIGALLVAGRAVLVQRGTTRAAKQAQPAPPFARHLLRELGARRTRLVVGDADVGPHVAGIVRPRIVVPPALLADMAMLRAVLLHELAHVRRLDAVARLIQIMASALMWWNPVVRFVHRRLELAREAACDAWALEAGGVSRASYARLLLRMASLRTHAHTPALAAPLALDARVKAVLDAPVRARLTHLHRVVICGWAVLALGGARSATARGRVDVCTYTSAMASALYDRFPDADADGDGMLSHDEACDLQAELRRVPEERTSRLSPQDAEHLETLVCDDRETPETFTCTKAEGVEK